MSDTPTTSNLTTIHRVVMAKSVAEKWLLKEATPEYRLTVYNCGKEDKNLPMLLRSYRDSRLRLGGLNPITDMGMKDQGDRVVLWSTNKEAMTALANWFDKHNYENSGLE